MMFSSEHSIDTADLFFQGIAEAWMDVVYSTEYYQFKMWKMLLILLKTFENWMLNKYSGGFLV